MRALFGLLGAGALAAALLAHQSAGVRAEARSAAAAPAPVAVEEPASWRRAMSPLGELHLLGKTHFTPTLIPVRGPDGAARWLAPLWPAARAARDPEAQAVLLLEAPLTDAALRAATVRVRDGARLLAVNGLAVEDAREARRARDALGRAGVAVSDAAPVVRPFFGARDAALAAAAQGDDGAPVTLGAAGLLFVGLSLLARRRV